MPIPALTIWISALISAKSTNFSGQGCHLERHPAESNTA
jgi:hypothetical protein